MKIIFGTIGILAAMYLGWYISMFIMLGNLFDGGDYNHTNLIENYEAKHDEIHTVIEYFQSIVPCDILVNIEFDDDEIAIFHVVANGKYDSNWNITTALLLNE